MRTLKSAHELASKRVISSRYERSEEEKPELDFIPIPEFEDKTEVVIEGGMASFVSRGAEDEKDQEEIEEAMNEVAIEEPKHMTYDGKTVEVIWNGHFMDYGGFARINRTMAFGLSNRNAKVRLDIDPYMVHVNEATQRELNFLEESNVSDKAPKVFGCTVPLSVVHSGKKIAYTMIETSEKVHPDYVGKLNLMDEIWVPTNYNKKILQNSGCHPPIKIMSLGVDISRYKPDESKANFNFGPATRKFRFLSVFRWSYRKGYDILLKAYLEEFGGNEDVSLIMVSRPVNTPEQNGVSSIVESFNGIKQTIDKDEADLPHVSLYAKPVKELYMPSLYNSADAFALISRGEGFGIPYIEAGACGLPVIGSICSGQSDFLTEENSFSVKPDDYAEASIGGFMSTMAKECRFYEDQKFPVFDRDSIDAVRKQMRTVYQNYGEALDRARTFRKEIVNNYTWDMAVERVYDRLKEINEGD